jgi:hypothetical protein
MPPVLKRTAGPGVAFLLGVGLQLSGWTVHWLGWILIGMAVVWATFALPAVAERLPVFSWDRGGDGVVLRIRRPARSGRRRLRRDALALAGEIHAHVQSAPVPHSRSSEQFFDNVAAMKAAQSEAERNQLWREYTNRSTEEWAREAQQLTALFGGRMQYLAEELRRRGRITDLELRKLEWEVNSLYWLADAATTIEAAALRL